MSRPTLHYFCGICAFEVYPAWRFCPMCGLNFHGTAKEDGGMVVNVRPECADYTPPGFSGHWIDWHRGHGCHLDDGKPRRPAAVKEIAALTSTLERAKEEGS